MTSDMFDVELIDMYQDMFVQSVTHLVGSPDDGKLRFAVDIDGQGEAELQWNTADIASFVTIAVKSASKKGELLNYKVAPAQDVQATKKQQRKRRGAKDLVCPSPSLQHHS